jgi:hypothetical protein
MQLQKATRMAAVQAWQAINRVFVPTRAGDANSPVRFSLRWQCRSETRRRSYPVTKKSGFKAWSLAASLGLSVTMISGCNPEEPAPTGGAPSAPPAVKQAPKPADSKGAVPPPIAPEKKDPEKK